MLSHVREQPWQQLKGNVTELWQLLGLQPDSLPSFAEAMLADERVIKGIADASASPPRHVIRPLSEGCPPMLQARYRTICKMLYSLAAMMRQPAGMMESNVRDWVREGLPVSLDAHSRQQRHILQAVCWMLPELLLRVALLCGEGQPLVVTAAAEAATGVMSYWHAPGMETAAAAAKPRQLPALLDCLLQLMQQLLLQPMLASRRLAATDGVVQQQPGNTLQKQQPPGLLLQVAATARLLPSDSTAAQRLLGAGTCSCETSGGDSDSKSKGNSEGTFGPDKHCSSSSGSASISSVKLRCDSLMAFGGLLKCLGAMKVRGTG